MTTETQESMSQTMIWIGIMIAMVVGMAYLVL